MKLEELFLSPIIIQKRKRVTRIVANHVSFMPISESSKAMADKPCRKPVNCKKGTKRHQLSKIDSRRSSLCTKLKCVKIINISSSPRGFFGNLHFGSLRYSSFIPRFKMNCVNAKDM